MPQQQLFFILGRERSGTTLLCNLLNNHPEVFVPPESPFISFLASKYAGKKTIYAKEFIEDLYKEPYFNLWKVDKEDLLASLKKASKPDFTTFCKIVLQAKTNKNPACIGDKNPTHSVFARQLQKKFPEAKFIWLIRDYRAQVNSMLKVNFEQKNCTSLSIRWKKYNQEIYKIYKKNPAKVCLVRYEDLVSIPSKKLKEISAFLGIEFLENLTINHNHQQQFIPEHHKSLKKALNTNAVSSWKEELSKEEIAICERYAGKFGKKFGYEKTFQKIKPPIDFKGLFLGLAYVPFIKVFQKIPLRVRVKIIQKFIMPNFKFWQESKKSIQEKTSS